MALLITAGIVGWVAVLSTTMRLGHVPSLAEAGSIVLFLAVVAGARSLAFPLPALGTYELSLDGAILIAAVACLGPGNVLLGLSVLLAADGLRRGIVQRRPVGSLVIDAIYFGGVTGGLVALVAHVFGIVAPIDAPTFDGAVAGADAHPLVWLVPEIGGAFLVAHYFLQSVQQWLSGLAWRVALRRNLRCLLAEATLLPLASGILLVWNPARPARFALLGGTYLMVNFGFWRLALLAAALRRRVVELQTLNRTAHALGASLEVPQLIEALLRETAVGLPRAERLEALLLRDGQCVRYVGEGGGLQKRDPDERATELAHSSELLLDEQVDDPARPHVRARLLVPLTMYGETIGALLAESSVPSAFGPNELRLLDAIGGQTAAAVENARLYALANVDGLTNLYCRRYFDLRVSEEIERARRFGTSFALVMLDLDDFKRLNDTYGHLCGDRVLREAAALAARQLRGVDLAARYGGEELAFLLPRTSLIDAHAVAERIRTTICNHDFAGLRITASLGVAGWTESGVDDPGSLVARADAALYRAKAAGKNRVEIDLASFELTPSLAPVRRRAQ
jgi:diguanylate cyclase (GGDEF)-like protein